MSRFLDRLSDTKYPSFPLEKHWASLHYEPEQPQIEQNPAPPPLGGGVSSFWGETKPGPVRPCVQFWRPGREQHQRSPKSASLGACEPVVSSSCQRQLPREALGYEVSVFSCGKAPGFSLVKIQTGAESRQKRKSRPSRACKGNALQHRIGLDRKEIFSPLRGPIGED